jgi:hypothetical protein
MKRLAADGGEREWLRWIPEGDRRHDGLKAFVDFIRLVGFGLAFPFFELGSRILSPLADSGTFGAGRDASLSY